MSRIVQREIEFKVKSSLEPGNALTLTRTAPYSCRIQSLRVDPLYEGGLTLRHLKLDDEDQINWPGLPMLPYTQVDGLDVTWLDRQLLSLTLENTSNIALAIYGVRLTVLAIE